MAINSKLLRRNDFLREKIHALSKIRAKEVASDIKIHLKPNDKIIDIGSGNCNVCEVLISENFEVTAVDIKNLSFVETVNPIIYDGKKLPFRDNDFDVALLLFVLHHCPDPEKIIIESARVAKRIIILEDIYSNVIRKYLTYFFDSALNQEFMGHPHSNKNDCEWKSLFAKLNLELKAARYENWYYVMDHAAYYLEKTV